MLRPAYFLLLFGALLPLAAAADELPPPTASLFDHSSAAAFAGVKGDVIRFEGGAWGDALLVSGVALEASRGALGVDANLHFVGTPAALGARPGVSGALRLGYAGERFQGRLGAVAQVTTTAALQWLPSAHVRYAFDELGLSAGVFDGLGYVPVHVSIDWDKFSFGWAGLVGLRAAVRVPLSQRLALQFDGFAFSVGNYQSALLTVSSVFTQGQEVSR